MYCSEILMCLSSAFELFSYIQLIKNNKNKKSIYGLSYDFIILTWVSYVVSTIVSINYLFDMEVITQYKRRFPLHPELKVSGPIFLIDIVGTVISSGLLLQIYSIYYKTKNSNQRLSGSTVSYLLISMIFLFSVIKACIKGQRALVLLDVIDYLWLFNKVTAMIKLCPQLTVNWFDMSVSGLSHSFFPLQVTSTLLLALGKLSLDKNKWYAIPVNYNTWCHLCLNSIFLTILYIQKNVLYVGMKPRLKEEYPENKIDV